MTERQPTTMPRRTSIFGLSVTAVALLLVAACLAVAWQQWFFADDFAYLAQARGAFAHRPWTWHGAFLPDAPGFNWAYRPLSLEVFFFLGNEVFGQQAFGYLATSLAFHFGSGVLLYLLARRLAFHPHAALFAALLSVARFPTLAEVFWICVFSYVLSKFWMIAAVLLALAALRRRRFAWRLALLFGSAAATGAAVLSQELAIVTPAIVATALVLDGRLSGVKQPWSHLALGAALQLAVAGVWLYVRFGVIVVAPQPAAYGPYWGWNLVLNPLKQIALVFTSWPILVAVLVFWLGAVGVVRARREAGPSRGWLLRVSVLGLAWLAAVLAPFVVVGGALPRFSIPAEAPISLIIGAAASALWFRAGGRLRAIVPAAALITVIATIPYQTLWENAARPRGAGPRALVEFVERLPDLRPGTRVIVLYGGERLASADAAKAFEEDAWHSTALMAAKPGRGLTLVMRDVSREAAIQACEACVHVELAPDLTLRPISPP